MEREFGDCAHRRVCNAIAAKAQDVPVMMVPGTRLPGPDENEIVANLRATASPRGPSLRKKAAKAGPWVLDTAHRSAPTSGQRRLYAEPHPPADLRRPDESDSRRSRSSDLHGALNAAVLCACAAWIFADSCWKSSRLREPPPSCAEFGVQLLNDARLGSDSDCAASEIAVAGLPEIKNTRADFR